MNIFGAAFAILLLTAYAIGISLGLLIWLGHSKFEFAKFATELNTVGGLITAVVVAKLGLTKPGTLPSLIIPAKYKKLKEAAPYIVTAYIGIWFILGAAAYLVTHFVEFKREVKELVTFSESWFGTAVAAAYAYFGLQKP